MSTPIIFIIIPIGISIGLYLLRRYKNLTTLLGVATALILAWLAYHAAEMDRWNFAPLPIEVVDTLAILGRRLVIPPGDAPVLIFVYVGVAFWLGGSLFARVDGRFVPACMGMAAVLVAAFAVEPFLYAALLFELAVLISVMMLVAYGRPVARGILRFLIYQTLGMPFILFVGWLLAGVEANPGNPALVQQVDILLGLGFAFLLGIFPFHTWMPMMAEETHPYVAAFILHILPLVVTLFGLGFLDRFAWLRNQPGLYTTVQIAGVVMVVTGGWFIAYERHLGRMMGFSVMLQVGLSLLAIGTGVSPEGRLPLLRFVLASTLPRGLGLGIWSLALVQLAKSAKTLEDRAIVYRFRSVQGIARHQPISSASALIAHFSLSGLPLLVGFPVYFPIWEGLARNMPVLAWVAVLGSIGAFMGGIRSLAVLVMGKEETDWEFVEDRRVSVLLITGVLAILVIGVFPQWFYPFIEGMTQIFQHLGP